MDKTGMLIQSLGNKTWEKMLDFDGLFLAVFFVFDPFFDSEHWVVS